MKWQTGFPRKRGWYLCKDDNGLRVRAFGQGVWWTDLGRGSGRDGWVAFYDADGQPEPRTFIGRCGDIMDDKPSIPQAVRNLSKSARDAVMREAADIVVEHQGGAA